MAAKSVWDYVFANAKAVAARFRSFTKSGTGLSEISGAAELSTTVTTDSTGAYTLDYAAMGFLEITGVTLTPIASSNALANTIQAELVGAPSLTSLKLQVTKPATIVVGGLTVAVAGISQVYVSVRGRVALS